MTGQRLNPSNEEVEGRGAQGNNCVENGWKLHVLGAYLLFIPAVLLILIINFWPMKAQISQEALQTVKVEKVEPVQATDNPAKPSQEETAVEDPQVNNQPNQTPPIAQNDINWSEKTNIFNGTISFELRMLLLICLAGMMGSYIHTATSFAYHIGAMDFQSNWLWWYYLRLPIGAGLAFVFILLFRSGFYVMQNSDPASVSDPIATIGLAALVGLFAPQALDKLGDIFTVVFNPKDRSKNQGNNNNNNGNGNENNGS